MTEGMMGLATNVAIGAAICGLMGWMMSVGSRYRSTPARGLGVGLLFGISMMAPFAALWPILQLSETPYWLADLWLGSAVLYQASLGVVFAKHRGSGVAAAKIPAKESLKVEYPSLGLLKNDISPAA